MRVFFFSLFLALFAIAVLGDEHSLEKPRKFFGHLGSSLGGNHGGNNGGKDVVVVIDKDNHGHRYDSYEHRPIIIRQKEKPVHVVAPVVVDRPHRPQYYRSRERDYSWEYIKRRRHRPHYYESNGSSDEDYKRRKNHKHKGASSEEQHHHYHFVNPHKTNRPYWGGWGGDGWNGGSGWNGGGGWNGAGGWNGGGGGGKGHGHGWHSNEDSDSSGDRGGHGSGKGKGNRS